MGNLDLDYVIYPKICGDLDSGIVSKTMSGNFDNANGAPSRRWNCLSRNYSALYRQTAEASRLSRMLGTSAYGASPQQRFGFPMERHSYISTPHTSTSLDPVHWKDPTAFDPSRYLSVPTSAQVTEDKCQQIGLARCPFEITNFQVKDGRNANITNSGFGTVFGVVDGKSLPVCDYAGFCPIRL